MLKATLIGNLGNDPDMRSSASGAPLLRFNVASNYRTRTPEGEYQDKTEWVRVTVTGARAESLGQYLKKGSRVYVEGRLEARPWTDREGQVRSGLHVLANEVQFMSSRSDDEQRGEATGSSASGDPPRERSSPRGPAPARPAAQSAPAPMDEGDLEDLPF
jgi:single-strand DNA-binding protein